MNTPATQHVRWDLDYDIHLGSTWGRFMQGLREKKILANTCPECRRVFVPPQAYCESCFVRTDEWLELPQEGVLEVFTVVARGFTGGPTPPYVIGAIRLDGADTLLIHLLRHTDQGDDGSRLEVGDRVRAVWAEDRSGHILDISRFEPIA